MCITDNEHVYTEIYMQVQWASASPYYRTARWLEVEHCGLVHWLTVTFIRTCMYKYQYQVPWTRHQAQVLVVYLPLKRRISSTTGSSSMIERLKKSEKVRIDHAPPPTIIT
jgi:hypothetical protein